MTITINIESAAEYQWIAKYLDELKSHPTAKVNIHNADEAAWDKAVDGLRDFIKHDAPKVDKIGHNPNGNSWENQVDSFLEFADNVAITVDKIEIPNREERNAR